MAIPITRPAVCRFLSYLHRIDTPHGGKRVLDCGAGGRYPPLALFHERGYETFGIDISDEQIEHANTFCNQHRMDLTIIKGDMRHIPFKNETFNIIYECDSMCHLTKSDTCWTIQEMWRVLKKGGYCSLGFMTRNRWPLDGEERNPGEFWSYYEGEEYVHSHFTDDEPDTYLKEFEIMWKGIHTELYRDSIAEMSLEEWMDWYDDTWTQYSRNEWKKTYRNRIASYRYSMMQYIAKKPT
jgi:ubiquinone/menaquinone biosynthesis C-methylase UbiE